MVATAIWFDFGVLIRSKLVELVDSRETQDSTDLQPTFVEELATKLDSASFMPIENTAMAGHC